MSGLVTVDQAPEKAAQELPERVEVRRSRTPVPAPMPEPPESVPASTVTGTCPSAS